MSDLIPWLFLIPPGLVTILALGTYVHGRTAAGRALRAMRKGGVHLYQEEWDQAEAAFREGLTAKPEHPGLLGSLASVLVSQENYQEAQGVLDKAIIANAGDVRLKMTQGQCKMGLGQTQEALELWRAIPEDSDVYVDAQSLLAKYHEAEGDLSQAMESLERAIKQGTVHQVRPHKKELRRLKKLQVN